MRDELKLKLLKKLPAQHGMSRFVGEELHFWSSEDLWKMSASLPVIEMNPTAVIDLDKDAWFAKEPPSPRNILKHMKRILAADLSFPVILDFDGTIMDGAHRTCRAILEDLENIKVVEFSQTPEPSKIIRE